MKKLLITTDSFLPRWDGVARFLDEVIPRLRKYYKITVIAPNYGGVKYKGIKLIKFSLARFRISGYRPAKPNLGLIKKFVEDTDLIFNQTPGPIGVLTVLYANKIKKPVISYAHSIEWELFPEAVYIPSLFKKRIKTTTKKLARLIYNKCSLILVASDDVAQKLKRNKIKAKTKVVKLGLSKEFIPGNTKKKFNLDDKIVIGYCGRLSREKNLETLLKAFNKLKYEKKFLLIVGDGPYRKLFIKNKRIKLVKNAKDIVKYLQAMDIFVMPSLTETSSLATLEAMRCGLPILCTKVGYMMHYIKDGFNGYFIPKKSSSYLAKILIKLIKNKKLRAKLGKNARRSVAKLNWGYTAKGLMKEFKRFI
ncbi:MAG: glycosyltransferase family 4 protein [Nanoarchaeota archaeon]